jgi:hypothetical protein
MKNTRKNKTNQVLSWPTTPYYTIQELFDKNKHFNATITVRVRHTKALEAGETAEIGRVTGGKGAPPKVYAKTPITDALLEKAKANGIQLADNVRKLVNVINVTRPTVTAAVSPVATSSPVTK